MSAQFDDAEEGTQATPTPLAAPLTSPLAPSTGAAQLAREFGRVDDPDALAYLDEDEEEDEEEEEEYWSEEDAQWDLAEGMAALNSQDWAEGSGGQFALRFL